MIAEYELTEQDAHTLTASREFADRFEAAAKTAKNPRRVANLLLSELGGRLKALGPRAGAVARFDGGRGAGGRSARRGQDQLEAAQAALRYLLRKGRGLPAVYEREKPQQITDASAIEAMIDEVIAANPKQVEQYRAGKKTMAGFFVGQVMKASKGQANPALLNELVTKKLDELRGRRGAASPWTCLLLHFQFGLKFLARVPGTDGLGLRFSCRPSPPTDRNLRPY